MPVLKKNAVPVLLVSIATLFAAACSKPGAIRMTTVTHLGMGQSVNLSAYEEKRPSHFLKGTDPSEPFTRETVEATWSVSDPAVASISETGVLQGLKAGQVTVKAVWKGSEFSETVKVVPDLRAKVLPQLEPEGQISPPKEIHLALNKDRSLQLDVAFDQTSDNLALKQKAPNQRLPWQFTIDNGTVEIADASGHAVRGTFKNKAGGKLSFATWSDGDGVYPISLNGKTVMVVGDSMADGLAWFMKDKVEDAGGRFVGEAWNSSTTTSWQADRRMSADIAKYQPDIIFLALGSNEVEARDMEKRGPAVRSIAQEMGDRPGYWVGPPSWVPDKGIVKTIEENFRPGHFYNANDLKVPRRGDGKHPNRDGFKIWVDLLWDWYANVA